MADQQAGAPAGAEQRGAPAPTHSPQMAASDTRRLRPPVQAAFGTAGGAALVFRDFASI